MREATVRVPRRRTRAGGSPVGPRLRDLLAGVTVALVLIPQSIAYAQLAGMPEQQGLFADLPTAALAAIVVLAVAPLMKPTEMVSVLRWSRPQFAITATAFVATLAFEPHVEWGLLAAVAVAIGIHLWKELGIEVDHRFDGTALELAPVGVLWFATARGLEDSFVRLLAAHPSATRLNLRLDRIDLSGALVLQAVVQDARAAGLEIQVSGAPPQARRVLDRVLDVPIAHDGAPA